MYVRHLVEASLCPFSLLFQLFHFYMQSYHPFLSFLYLNIIASFFLSLFLHQKYHFSSFSLESRIKYYLLLLQCSSPYAGRRSTNKVVEWYNLLILETKAYIRESSVDTAFYTSYDSGPRSMTMLKL